MDLSSRLHPARFGLVVGLLLFGAMPAALRAGDPVPSRDDPRPSASDTPPAPISSTLVERVDVRFVTFDLFVERRGKGGWRPAIDLRREDVTVLLGGRPVKLEMFERHCGQEEGVLLAAGDAATEAAGASGGAALETRAAQSTADPHSPGPPLRTILYFDLTHLTNEGANLAYKAALDWASTGVQADDEVMIVNGGDILRIVRPFLPAAQHLREDLIAAREGSRYFERWAEFEDARAAEIVDVAEMGGAAAALSSFYGSQDYRRVSGAIRSLRLLMTLFDAIDGPKNLLLFESTIRAVPGRQYPYSNPGELTDDVGPLGRLAKDANERDVRIYPVHTEGVEGPADDAMTMLASETGGRVYERSNALVPAFERAAQDADCFYRLGFPSPREYRGDSERIEVRVGDGRGYRLRHRRTVADPTREERELDALRAAMLVPEQASAFALAVTAAPLWGGEATGRARVEVRLALADLIALPGATPGELSARAQFGITVVPLRPLAPGETRRPGTAWADAAPRKKTWSTAWQAELDLPASWSASADPRDVVVRQEIEAPAGAYAVIAVAQDRLAGAVSSAAAEFEIPREQSRLGALHLAAVDPRAIEAVLPVGEEPEEDPGPRNGEIRPVSSSLPGGMTLRFPAIVSAADTASVVVALCDPGGSGIVGREAAADAGKALPLSFTGWHLEQRLACAASATALSEPIAAPPDGAPCAVVLHPLPRLLPPGDCELVVTLDRPGEPSEDRQLAIRVVTPR